MTAYLLKRLAHRPATLLVASIVVFAVLEILPGDPARLMLGMNATEDAVAGAARADGARTSGMLLRYLHLGRRAADPRFRPLLHLFGAGHRSRSPNAPPYRCRWR